MKEDKKLENLSTKYLHDLPLEEVPPGFSDCIMAQIKEKPANSLVFTYRPLVSRKLWITVFLLWVFVGFYFSSLETVTEGLYSSKQFQYLDINLPKIQIPHLPSYLPQVTLVFSLVAFVEIVVLKRFFNARYTGNR